MWGDEKFSTLSKPQPNAQSLWIYLLTGPHTTALPCAFATGEASLAEALAWPLRGFRKAFQELSVKDMVQYDWRARLVFIPNALKHNSPENPNVVIGWKSSFDELPDCPLKWLIYDGVRAYLLTLVQVKGFSEVFLKPFKEELPKTDTVTGTRTGTGTGAEAEAAKPPPPKLRFGDEFHAVELTEIEHSKLLGQFSGNLERFINRLDRFSEKNPKQFGKYRSHYAVLLDWYDRDADEGKVPSRNKTAALENFHHRPEFRAGRHICTFCPKPHPHDEDCDDFHCESAEEKPCREYLRKHQETRTVTVKK